MNRSAAANSLSRENRQVASTITRNIEIRRFFTRSIREEVAQGHIIDVMRSFSGKWKLELVNADSGHWYVEIENKYPTEVAFYFTLTGPNTEHAEIDFQDAMVSLASKFQSIKTGSVETKYRIHAVDGVSWKPMTAKERMAASASRNPDGMVEYADVVMPSPEDVKVYFEGLYDIDSQINMVVRKMRRAIENGFEFRDHCLLQGEPGCGKSQTLINAAKMFSPDAVLKIDGTAMTSAGVIEILKEIPVMPRFIFVEEIDKAPNDAVSVLLGLMDKHGQIRKTTYRDNIQREARVCVFATANNMDKIERMQEGALASRFGNAITYSRPDENGLRRILHRELNSYELAMCCKPSKDGTVCGKCKECIKRNKWIEATLDWCKLNQSIMKADTMDPRFVIQMCIVGQDDLLTGDYQRDVEKTSIKSNITDFSQQ